MEYKPNYALGQILVVFKNRVSEGFAEDLGTIIGYELSHEEYIYKEAYLFKTPVGKEKEAIEKFREYTEFVDWVDFRDLKMESRWNNLEKIMNEVQKLHDCVELPDDKYNQRFGEIRDSFIKLTSESD